MHHAGGRVRPIERRRRSEQHLDPFDVLVGRRRQPRRVETERGNEGVAVVGEREHRAREDVVEAARDDVALHEPRLHGVHPRKVLHELGRGERRALLDHLWLDGRDRGRGFRRFLRFLPTRCRHDRRVEEHGLRGELDVHLGWRARRDRDTGAALRREAVEAHVDGVGLLAQRRQTKATVLVGRRSRRDGAVRADGFDLRAGQWLVGRRAGHASRDRPRLGDGGGNGCERQQQAEQQALPDMHAHGALHRVVISRVRVRRVRFRTTRRCQGGWTEALPDEVRRTWGMNARAHDALGTRVCGRFLISPSPPGGGKRAVRRKY